MSLPGRFVDTSCGRVFVHRAGKGEPLVVLHGFCMSHFNFAEVLPALTNEHEVIAIDLPGFGESDRPSPSAFAYDYPAFAGIVGEVLDRLGVARVSLLGSSLGGGVAIALAAGRPERIARLVLVGAALYPLPFPAPAQLLFVPGVGPLLWQHAMRRVDLRRVLVRDVFRDPRFVTDDFVDYYWARMNRAGGREAAYATLLTLWRLSNSTSDPGRVTAPTLILWGEEDRQVPLAHGKRLQRAIPGARLSVVPASGHLPFIERSAEFLRQLRPFLSSVAQAGAHEPSRSHAS